MHSESYRIIPDRHNFLSFLQTLELSPEQNACIRKIPLDYVEINERTNTWKISYGVETNPLEEQNLMAVAKKIAAACCVEEVSFINEKARDVYPPCEEDKPRDSVDVAFSLPEMPEMEIIPLPEEPPELLDENEEPMDAAAEMTFQSKAYQNALRALQQQGNQKSGGKDVVYGRKITKKPRTMDEIVNLAPDSVTVHSLALKRAAFLNQNREQFPVAGADEVNRMIGISHEGALAIGAEPYYLYRQKNIAGNLENVGYARKGCEGLYNILIMEEKQTILALGAGASSKFVFNSGDGHRIERVENVKSVKDYIERIDEMIDRKKNFLLKSENSF